ncbi:PTS sugar transporter subunit IIB [Nitratidesulfovibrio vulgaris]|uniref:PTS system, IIB component n=2 Tax=Nitratidesulfovibrio vulgaris TaxID=881 RepID=Q72BK2_NITV2|nr:PTS sugar transporter subunit IIB [Nitratidesulfovibrio vulgaris]HBW16838.1 PTS mannose/fructose/sorbose transporter subunit IIB [Desulfovibrio sp.]AAS96111.1 PTS system, IIB component [Nitratidesulfovibrio vulgaris str. Hildenborough]ABM28517.1 PTS system sorbose subfamily IIB component [Nitratidesulfovibrio vulgaris DP4]ADP86810.1 PTS system sorbose subfamily IIB component [Nitratidesulfovibrio vulgaris RCH1]WCB48040.1 PTS sugar transporter subunit IIB [Nitratidesulfovibrio vulgaris]
MFWYRIDNRLVHGQIIEAWLPYTGATRLLVVNDALASDDLQQQIISLAIPGRVEVRFLRVDELKAVVTAGGAGRVETLVLVANCGDARRLHDAGVQIGVLNVGNLHYSPGKKQLCAHVAVSDEDEGCMRYLQRGGIELDFRCVPNDPVEIKGW